MVDGRAEALSHGECDVDSILSVYLYSPVSETSLERGKMFLEVGRSYLWAVVSRRGVLSAKDAMSVEVYSGRSAVYYNVPRCHWEEWVGRPFPV